jgi:hypothetical protein
MYAKKSISVLALTALSAAAFRMTSLPPSTQTPAQFVGRFDLLIDPDHTHHEAETKDIDETSILVATASVQPLMMSSEALK